MKNFQYQIIRYRHDILTGEFINVGLVFFIPSEKHLEALVTRKYKRIADFYDGVSGSSIVRSLRSLENKINVYAERMRNSLDFLQAERLDKLLTNLYPEDDGSIQFSNLYTGVNPSSNFRIIFDELYDQLVNKYNQHYESISRTDEDAKKIVYREFFDKLNISSKLVTNEVKTSNDTFEFEGWKNGKWNFYKPISFDLLDPSSIKDKVYKWAGINAELFTSEQSFVLYFLSLSPRSVNDENIRTFIKSKLEQNSEKQQIHVIEEEDFSRFTQIVSEEINT